MDLCFNCEEKIEVLLHELVKRDGPRPASFIILPYLAQHPAKTTLQVTDIRKVIEECKGEIQAASEDGNEEEGDALGALKEDCPSLEETFQECAQVYSDTF